jgi:hypothetical protein
MRMLRESFAKMKHPSGEKIWDIKLVQLPLAEK